MDIERSNDTMRIVYHIHARLQYECVLLHLSGPTTWCRANRRNRWQEQSVIFADERSPTGYRAYQRRAQSAALENERDYELVIPDDVRAEALAAITVLWAD